MKIPDGAKVSVEGSKVTVSGPKGTLSRVFPGAGASIQLKDGELSVSADKRMARTIETHIQNMAIGVTSGYSKKLKALYSHFPISTEVKGQEILIKNFLGEKQPRKAKIVGQTKVEVKGQELTVSGISKEDVSQTIANLKSATRIRDRDSRIFQDGYYVIEE
ncbi:MAG: 50S ribosomal protein L6 [Candidatus Micrarchaeota archaeon]|nr:50S ribosomal protein L6 [Candidatus Micrarchaeota archaeon]